MSDSTVWAVAVLAGDALPYALMLSLACLLLVAGWGR